MFCQRPGKDETWRRELRQAREARGWTEVRKFTDIVVDGGNYLLGGWCQGVRGQVFGRMRYLFLVSSEGRAAGSLVRTAADRGVSARCVSGAGRGGKDLTS